MRMTYNAPVVSLHGKTAAHGGLTCRLSAGQNVASRTKSPDLPETGRRSLSRSLFQVVKAGFGGLSPSEVSTWAAFAADPETASRFSLAVPGPWSAYFAVNRFNYLTGRALSSTPPTLSPTWTILSVYRVLIQDTTPPILGVWTTFSRDEGERNWLQCRISEALPSHQRTATNSELRLANGCQSYSMVLCPAGSAVTFFRLYESDLANGDWVNILLTPLNDDFVPGADFRGKLTTG